MKPAVEGTGGQAAVPPKICRCLPNHASRSIYERLGLKWKAAKVAVLSYPEFFMIKVVSPHAQKLFFSRLNRKLKSEGRPIFANFELTYKCNFSCPFCYLRGSSPERPLKTEQVFEILRQMKELGVWQVDFTGGEPLLRRDVFDILRYSASIGLTNNLFTNGSRINRSVARKLKAANLTQAQISLHGFSTDTFNRLSSTAGFFPKVKKAITLLTDEGIRVGIRSAAMLQNEKEIPLINAFARSLKIRYDVDFDIVPYRTRIFDWRSRYALGRERSDRLRREVYPEMFRPTTAGLVGHVRKKGCFFSCPVGVNRFVVSPSGKMNFCIEANYPGYDILTLGLRQCWEKVRKEVAAFNRNPRLPCKHCDLIEYCEWCPAKSHLVFGDFTRCSPEVKELALQKKNFTTGG